MVYVLRIYEPNVLRFPVDAPTSPLPPIALPNEPSDVVFNRAGTLAYVAGGSAIHVIDVAAGTRSTIPLTYPPSRIALSRDESRLFVSSPTVDSHVSSVPTAGGAAVSVALSGYPRAMAVSPTSGALFAGGAGVVHRLDPTSLAVQATSPLFAGSVLDLVVSPDGTRVYAATAEGRLRVLDATSLAERFVIETGPATNAVVMSPDGKQLYFVSDFGQLTIYAREEGLVVKQIQLGGTPAHAAFDPLGKVAFIGNGEMWVDAIR
jgi:DNA-binding beta-propeller fold protein YncE